MGNCHFYTLILKDLKKIKRFVCVWFNVYKKHTTYLISFTLSSKCNFSSSHQKCSIRTEIVFIYQLGKKAGYENQYTNKRHMEYKNKPLKGKKKSKLQFTNAITYQPYFLPILKFIKGNTIVPTKSASTIKHRVVNDRNDTMPTGTNK